MSGPFAESFFQSSSEEGEIPIFQRDFYLVSPLRFETTHAQKYDCEAPEGEKDNCYYFTLDSDTIQTDNYDTSSGLYYAPDDPAFQPTTTYEKYSSMEDKTWGFKTKGELSDFTSDGYYIEANSQISLEDFRLLLS